MDGTGSVVDTELLQRAVLVLVEIAVSHHPFLSSNPSDLIVTRVSSKGGGTGGGGGVRIPPPPPPLKIYGRDSPPPINLLLIPKYM